jgi:altronate dehydratase
MKRTASESKLSQVDLSLYRRGPNRYGTRNNVLVLASTFCCNRAVQKICESFRDVRFGANSENRVIPLVHTGGCCDVGFDEALVESVLIRMAANANFGGVLLVHLGCGEFCSTCGAQGDPQKNGRLIQALRKLGHVAEVVIQGPGGFSSAVMQGIEKVGRFVTNLKDEERKPVEFKLGVFAGVMNGSSDMTSPIANAAVGSFIDELVLDYGRAACGQAVEMLGAESEILSRARRQSQMGGTTDTYGSCGTKSGRRA